ncbi:alpha/beta hydrolase [Opitutaceae bacterium TAV4]|nr:alpha/beta hydrolase [Opitutaceae bacterium TAV4]RRK02832.1 alpha/beta hydrolase [Opitutaceae bacterium TAV3]
MVLQRAANVPVWEKVERGERIASSLDGQTVETPPSAAKPADAAPTLVPTYADVAYGKHQRQVLDFWKAESATPTPVVLYIHGGAWNHGDKANAAKYDDYGGLKAYLAEGISVVSINYRYAKDAESEGVSPPVKGPMGDAARALQFVRSKAVEWNIDKKRIAATGGSAGGCTSLWLAFHDDLADLGSDDPVARESTRLHCAAGMSAQTSLDPQQMRDWIPNITYGAHAFGFKKDYKKKLAPFDVFLASRDTILPWIAEYSPYALVTPDDPPIFLHYKNTPAIGEAQKDATHSTNFGEKLYERCKEAGVPCIFVHRRTPEKDRITVKDFLLRQLKGLGKESGPAGQ